MTGIEIQTPTGRFLCFAGLNRVFLIASIAASSSPVFGIPFKIMVSFTRPFSSIKACTTTTPSIPASCSISGYTGRIPPIARGGSSYGINFTLGAEGGGSGASQSISSIYSSYS